MKHVLIIWLLRFCDNYIVLQVGLSQFLSASIQCTCKNGALIVQENP